MKVQKVMSKDVVSCRVRDTANRAAQIMWELNVGIVPVLDGEELVGVVTDRDLAMGAYTQGRRLTDISLSSVMTHDVCFCRPSDEIAAAEGLMAEHQVRRLPVIEDGKLVGLVSLNDIARAASAVPDEVSAQDLGRTLSAIGQSRPIALA